MTNRIAMFSICIDVEVSTEDGDNWNSEKRQEHLTTHYKKVIPRNKSLVKIIWRGQMKVDKSIWYPIWQVQLTSTTTALSTYQIWFWVFSERCHGSHISGWVFLLQKIMFRWSKRAVLKPNRSIGQGEIKNNPKLIIIDNEKTNTITILSGRM